MKSKSRINQARRRKLWPTAEGGVGGIAGAVFEIAAAEVSVGLQCPLTASIADRRGEAAFTRPPSRATAFGLDVADADAVDFSKVFSDKLWRA